MPKSYACPICNKTYQAMAKHLQRTHSVDNAQEKQLLLQLASRRVNVRGSRCPVEACSYSTGRLDKHLCQGHPELRAHVREEIMDYLRRARTIELLQALRDEAPSTPISSSLSMDGLRTDWGREETERQEPPPSTVSEPPSSDEEEPGPSAAGAGPNTPAEEGSGSEAPLPASLGKTCLPFNSF